MQGSKKIQVKLGQLDRTSMVLKELVKEKLPFKASYWLRRDIDAISKVYQPFLESKQALFNEFAEKDEKGNIVLAEDKKSVKLLEDKLEEFWKQYTELASKDIDLEIYPLNIEWFDKVESSVEELAAIDFLIDGGEEVVKDGGENV